MQGADVCADTTQAADRPGHLGHARDEHEDVTLLLGQCPTGGGGHVVEEPRGDPAVVGPQYAGREGTPLLVHREQGAPHADHRRRVATAEQRRRALRLDGRRHGHDQQVLAQVLAYVDQQREGEVGVELPLVDLVEHHRIDPRQLGVALQSSQQQPRGDELDPGAVPDPALPAHGEAGRRAHRLIQQLGQPTGGGPGDDPPWLRDHDATPHHRRDRRWHQGGLARAGRRLDHRDPTGPQRGDDVRQPVDDREVGRRRQQAGDRVVRHLRSVSRRAQGRVRGMLQR